MARDKKQAPSGPNNGYLVSFGDTMTALLAFFIVLNSLAKEQTGANLHSGTGSYMETSESFGLPGIFKKKQSLKAFQLLENAPQYIVGSDEQVESAQNALGPDEESDQSRVIDRDKEQFMRFLTELKRTEVIRSETSRQSEFSIDIMGQFPAKVAPLQSKYRQAALQVAPLTLQEAYRIEITVWATTPSESAMLLACHRAHDLRQEIIQSFGLLSDAQQRIISCARPWISSDVKRPACSITIRKIY